MSLRSALSLPLLASALASVSAAQIPNDFCSNALPIVDGANGPYSNVGASLEILWPCASGDADLWFRYTATCTGAISFSTCDPQTNFDTALEILSDDCNNPISLACNDDSCGQQSTAIIPAVQGTSYLVRVGGYAGRQGSFQLNVTCTNFPANDDCAGALPIVDGTNGPFDNRNSTDSFPWPCEATAGSDVWFVYTATCTGVASFDTCTNTANFDPVLEVFDGTCNTLNSLGCDDDGCNDLYPHVVAPVVQGGTYFVRVGGWAQRQGSFDVVVRCATPLPNDECTGALPIFSGDNGPYSNRLATTSPEFWPCGQGGSDLWFSYRASCSTLITVGLCGAATNFDTVLEVLSGSCGNLISQGCNDDACTTVRRSSQLSFQSVAGMQYFIRVGGYDGKRGEFEIGLSLTGAGSITTHGTGCGNVNLSITGAPELGGDVLLEVQNIQGIGFLWAGLALDTPICGGFGCTLGPNFDAVLPATSVRARIPCDPTLRGGSILLQGADLGGTGGCPSGVLGPFTLSLTDTLSIDIG